MSHTKDFNNLNKNDVAIAGGKGASLGEMTQAGIPVPPGFVVLSGAFERFLEETDLHSEIDSILHKVDHKKIHTVENASEEIQALILEAKIPKDIAVEIKKQFKLLGSKFVAVRSSATAEDSSAAAWAGQLESYLNTTEKDLLQNVQKCWASLFTPRAIFYRFEKGLHGHHISVAVVVQKMIQSEVSGIAFSVHPVTQDYNQVIIEAGLGLGEAIVSGSITPDSYVVEKEPRKIINKNIQTKKSALSNSEILKLSELVLKIESHFGFPCDIEWALEKGKFYIVQSRPITTLLKSDLQQKIQLKPTVKRDLSLFSVQAWQKGYQDYLAEKLGWRYPILFYYDGQKVNFYHKMGDFKYFKETITAKVVSDDKLFKKLNKEFLNDINKLKSIRRVTAKNLSKIFELIASSMSFYIFVVSDSFVKERPGAWKSRNLSEGVLYLTDEKIELFLEELLKKHKLTPRLAHFLNRDEALKLADGEKINMEIVKKRMHTYILEEKDIITNENFSEYCARKLYVNSETEMSETQKSEIRGTIAYRGKAKGLVRIVANRKDLDKVQKGDILVATMTNVNYLSALKRAGAFITDEGGVTCHAAIMARELKKPCIIGTKTATQVLKDGDLVEVDADKGVVRILKP